MFTLLLALLVAGILCGLSGCAGLAATMEAIAKDDSTICGAAWTPYGAAVAVRAGAPGVTVQATATSCTVSTPVGK